jgi:hypothetical protein
MFERDAVDPANCERANALIDAAVTRRPGGHMVQAASFAKIIVSLFPDWFDFGSDKFAVLVWEGGFHLIVSGDQDMALISTSNSRCMSCVYFGKVNDQSRMDMHYQPSPNELDRAKTVIRLALTKLFPKRTMNCDIMALSIRDGKVFPDGWDMRFDSPKPDSLSDKRWWTRWYRRTKR